MSGNHPFHHLFETLGRIPHAHADAINRTAYQALLDALCVPTEHAGRCIMLRAPRAGHGKTHLLSRVQGQLAPGYDFIPLQPTGGSRIDAASVTDDTLRRLGRPLPAAGGLCDLDLIVRRLFARVLQPLVISGDIPCVDRDGALASLRDRPLETFDFHHPAATTAHWTRENFQLLGPRLSLELANLTGVAPRSAGFWLDALFHFAIAPVDQPGRVDSLAAAAYPVSGGDGLAIERLAALLAIVSQLNRVVLVADDLEGLSADESAALRLAAFLGTLRHAAPRVDVVLSINQDVWESAFVPRLSAGLADRLSEIVIELEPLTDEQVSDLLEARAPGLGAKIFQSLQAGGLPSHARGVLRAAAIIWTRVSTEPESPAEEPAPTEAAGQEAANLVNVAAPGPDSEPAVGTFAGSSFTSAAPEEPEEAVAEEVPAPVSQPEPAPAWQPPVFENPAPAEFQPPAPPESDDIPQWQPPAFSTEPEPATEPPAAPGHVEQAPAASPFSIPVEQPQAVAAGAVEPAPLVAKLISGLERDPVPAPQSVPSEPAASVATAWQDATAPSSPFSPAPQPEAATPPPQADLDRIEELLRQFRERYSKPGR